MILEVCHLLNRTIVRQVTVLRKEYGLIPGIRVRWPNAGEYTLDLRTNRLVTYTGNRISKKHPWMAVNLETAWNVYNRVKEGQSS